MNPHSPRTSHSIQAQAFFGAGIKPGRRFSRSVYVPQPDGPVGNWQEALSLCEIPPITRGAPGRDCREQAVPGLSVRR